MSLLHTVNKSPFEKNALETCLRIAVDGSAVLLIEDGVYGAMKGTSVNGMFSGNGKQLQFFVLGPDLHARGLREEDLMDGFEVIDYDGFVDLVVAHSATHACL